VKQETIKQDQASKHANHKSAGSKRPKTEAQVHQSAGVGPLPSKAGGLSASADDDA
jgi:hypothetical protein